jgi:hypothetical protein
MEVVFINTGKVFKLNDKDGILNYLEQLNLKKSFKLINKKNLKINESFLLEGTDNFYIRFINKNNYICQKPIDIYMYLKSLSFYRDGKIYEQDSDMVDNIYKNWSYDFVCLSYIDENNQIVSDYNMNIKMLENEMIRLFRKRYPLKYKNYSKTGDSKCSESSHGLIYGLVHRTTKNNLQSILKDGWLNPFHNPNWWWKQGIYMKLITINNYEHIVNPKNINLIFSLSLLDDLDYYINEGEDMGDRNKDSFYKGVKSNNKDLNKYSAAERAVIYNMDSGEIVFREPISLERYLEKIIEPNNNLYKKEEKVYYRKNCNGKIKNIDWKILDKYRGKSYENDIIPKEDLIELVKRNEVFLLKNIKNDKFLEIPYKKI